MFSCAAQQASMEKQQLPFSAENVLWFLLESLVCPVLAKLKRFGHAKGVEEDICRQMGAVALLYNYHICQELPTALPLNWEELCIKAALLHPKLSKFMGVGMPCSLTLTQRKVKSVCEVAEAIKSQNMKDPAVTKVSVCLLNFWRDRCVLALGTTTLGVWSFIESEKDNAVGGVVLSDDEFAFKTVQEHTGILKDVLQVEGSFVVVDDLTQTGGSSRFYIITCPGTFKLSPVIKLEKIAWVSLDTVFSKAFEPFIDVADSSVLCVDAIQYFHLRPFCSSLQSWLRQHELESMERVEQGKNSSSGLTDLSASDASNGTRVTNMAIDADTSVITRDASMTAAVNTILTAPNGIGSPQSCTSTKKRKEEQVSDKAGALLTMKRAFDNLRQKRKALSKELKELTMQADSIYKQMSDCDANLATLIEGGKPGLRLALQLDCSTANGGKQTFPSEVVSIDRSRREDAAAITLPRTIVPRETETSDRKRPFAMLKSSTQLNEICMRNERPLPSNWVAPVKSTGHNAYTCKVRIRHQGFELTETGEPSDTTKGSKLSATAHMLKCPSSH